METHYKKPPFPTYVCVFGMIRFVSNLHLQYIFCYNYFNGTTSITAATPYYFLPYLPLLLPLLHMPN